MVSWALPVISNQRGYARQDSLRKGRNYSSRVCDRDRRCLSLNMLGLLSWVDRPFKWPSPCGIFPDGPSIPGVARIGEEPPPCSPPARPPSNSTFPPTPEQQACSRAIDRGRTASRTPVERLHAASEARQPIHQVEEMIFRDLLAMGRCLLRAFVASAGDGDVGPALTLPGDSPSEPGRTLPRREAPRARPDLSIFGELSIE